jgi:hypothetical protein
LNAWGSGTPMDDPTVNDPTQFTKDPYAVYFDPAQKYNTLTDTNNPGVNMNNYPASWFDQTKTTVEIFGDYSQMNYNISGPWGADVVVNNCVPNYSNAVIDKLNGWGEGIHAPGMQKYSITAVNADGSIQIGKYPIMLCGFVFENIGDGSADIAALWTKTPPIGIGVPDWMELLVYKALMGDSTATPPTVPDPVDWDKTVLSQIKYTPIQQTEIPVVGSELWFNINQPGSGPGPTPGGYAYNTLPNIYNTNGPSAYYNAAGTTGAASNADVNTIFKEVVATKDYQFREVIPTGGDVNVPPKIISSATPYGIPPDYQFPQLTHVQIDGPNPLPVTNTKPKVGDKKRFYAKTEELD